MRKIKSIILLSICMVCLCSCGKKEDEATDTQYYAQQTTFETTEETEETTEVTTEERTTTETLTVESTIVTEEQVEINSNVDSQYDNYKDKLTLWDTETKTNSILIDGHYITLPCTYKEIIDTFGEPYIIMGKMPLYIKDNLSDYKKVVDETVYVTPKTGEGTIALTFTSDTPTDIQNCMCTKVGLYATTTGQSFEFALKDGEIHFGNKKEEIRAIYGEVSGGRDIYDTGDDGYFYINYSHKNYILEFYGTGNRLNGVIFGNTYKEE